jgi:hypothetical protein
MQDGYTQLQDKVLACCKLIYYTICLNRIGGVMVSVFTSSTVDRGFEPCSSQTKDYKIDICCFSTKHAELRRKSKDWLAQNQDTVTKCGDMSTLGLLFQ